MMDEIKKNELNEQEMENVAGGAFWAGGDNQPELITLKDILKNTSDKEGPVISFLRTDSMR